MLKSQSLTVIGLMSGTSMDGIDAALISTDGEGSVKDRGSDSLKYDQEFKILMKGVERAVFFSSGDLAAAEAGYMKILVQHVASAMGISNDRANAEVSKLAVYLYGADFCLSSGEVSERVAVERSRNNGSPCSSDGREACSPRGRCAAGVREVARSAGVSSNRRNE